MRSNLEPIESIDRPFVSFFKHFSLSGKTSRNSIRSSEKEFLETIDRPFVISFNTLVCLESRREIALDRAEKNFWKL